MKRPVLIAIGLTLPLLACVVFGGVYSALQDADLEETKTTESVPVPPVAETTDDVPDSYMGPTLGVSDEHLIGAFEGYVAQESPLDDGTPRRIWADRSEDPTPVVFETFGRPDDVRYARAIMQANDGKPLARTLAGAVGMLKQAGVPNPSSVMGRLLQGEGEIATDDHRITASTSESLGAFVVTVKGRDR